MMLSHDLHGTFRYNFAFSSNISMLSMARIILAQTTTSHSHYAAIQMWQIIKRKKRVALSSLIIKAICCQQILRESTHPTMAPAQAIRLGLEIDT
jgi:hypothetical protein